MVLELPLNGVKLLARAAHLPPELRRALVQLHVLCDQLRTAQERGKRSSRGASSKGGARITRGAILPDCDGFVRHQRRGRGGIVRRKVDLAGLQERE